jgi:hypothetical protein
MVTGSWVTADYSGENQRGDPLKCQVCTIRSMLQTLDKLCYEQCGEDPVLLESGMHHASCIYCILSSPWARVCVDSLLGLKLDGSPRGDDSLTRCYCLYDSNTLLFLSWTLRSADPLDSRLPRLPPRNTVGANAAECRRY